MEVKYPVTALVRRTVRNGLEFLVIAFAIGFPLALTSFALLSTNLPTWEIITCGVAGTLFWWRLCWFVFWLTI